MSRVIENKKNKEVKNVVQMIGFVMFTMVLVCCIAFFVTETVQGQREEITVDEQNLLLLEREYVSAVRGYLDAQGFENSGVNLTKIVEADGSRSYDVEVNHRKLERLTGEELEALFQALKDMAFEVEGCSFEVSVL